MTDRSVSQITRWIRSRRLGAAAAAEAEFYGGFPGSAPLESVQQWQLARFNALWRDIPFRVPYWADRMGDLPNRFASWRQFAELMPAMDRQTVQAHGADLLDPTEPPDYFRTTGGSSAEPVQIPSWARERRVCTADMWYARGWHGVDPGDRLFVFWGHRHLLGTGLRGAANAWMRRAKDRLSGYRRFSAYDLSDDAMRRAADELRTFRPHYVLGYASALDRFARVNADRSFADLNLKVAVATAESFPRADSRAAIEAVLGCRVAMEYGCVETGPLAYEHPDGSYHVFWRHYYLEGVPSAEVPDALELYVTCLHRRCFPLIRYRLGDLIEPLPGERSIRTRFASVRGRSDDLVRIGDHRIHYETFEHVLSRKPWVRGYQIVMGKGVRLRFVSPFSPTDAQIDELRGELSRLSPALRSIALERVDSLAKTRAGKLCHVVREGAA